MAPQVGTPRAVRVVQKEESEGRNIIRVGWVWSIEGTTYQVRPSLTLTQTLTLTLTWYAQSSITWWPFLRIA